MCTEKNNLYFEFPNFGFGPASTTIVVLKYFIKKNFQCSIISTGTALQYVKAHFSNINCIDIDTSSSKCLAQLESQIPQNSRIISNTNPEFLELARMKGFNVIGVDTLLWMWPEVIKGLDVEYLSQYYFGKYNTETKTKDFLDMNINYVKPIIDYEKLEEMKSSIESNVKSVFISFGGMDTPLDSEFPLEYARWVLKNIVSEILSLESVDEVYIVGGLVNYLQEDEILQNKLIKIKPSCTQDEYKMLFKSSTFQFVTPGLTSIYESAILGSVPFFLPAANVSQIMQQIDLVEYLNYNSLWLWPEQMTITSLLRVLPETEGLLEVKNFIKSCMNSNTSGDKLKFSVRQYLNNEFYEDDNASMNNLVENWADLPDVCVALETLLIKTGVTNA